MAVHIIPTSELMTSISNNPEVLANKIFELQTLIFEQFQDLSLVPTIFKIRDSFPHAKSGKRDTISMMQETDGFIKYPFDIKTDVKVKSQVNIGKKL